MTIRSIHICVISAAWLVSACSSSNGTSKPPPKPVAPMVTPDAASVQPPPIDAAQVDATINKPSAARPCGDAVCPVGQFCETRFKGHSVDDEGRPLERTKCMPLPAPCRAKPSCVCVKKHVSLTRCSETGGRIYTSDYPR